MGKRVSAWGYFADLDEICVPRCSRKQPKADVADRRQRFLKYKLLFAHGVKRKSAKRNSGRVDFDTIHFFVTILALCASSSLIFAFFHISFLETVCM